MSGEEEYKKPEFIYVENGYDDGMGDQKLLNALNELHRARFPWGLRLLALLGAIATAFLAFLFAFGTAVWFIVSALSLFRYRGSFEKAWRQTKKLIVITLGLLVAVFSPTLGFGFILLYFIITGATISDSIVERVMGQFHTEN